MLLVHFRETSKIIPVKRKMMAVLAEAVMAEVPAAAAEMEEEVGAVVDAAAVAGVAAADVEVKIESYEKDNHSFCTHRGKFYRTGNILPYAQPHYGKRTGISEVLFNDALRILHLCFLFKTLQRK